MLTRALPFLAALTLFACGPVIGDPCTVNTECGPGVCVNRGFAPGGLCSLVCLRGATDACPAGSVCVTGVIDGDTAGCLRSCNEDRDCRSGYVCRTERQSTTKVCIGTDGL